MGDPTSLANFLVGDWRREGLVGDGAFFVSNFGPPGCLLSRSRGEHLFIIFFIIEAMAS